MCGICHDRSFAARATHGREAGTGKRPCRMQQFQCFQEGRDRVDPRDPEPFQKGLGRGIRPRKRCRVRHRRRPCLFRPAHLHRHDGLAEFARSRRELLETGNRIEAFDVKAERRYPVILDEAQCNFGQAGLRLVSRRHQIGDGQPPPLHRHVDGDVGRLGDDRNATLAIFEPASTMLVRPQRRTVDVVDEPVAIGPDHRHVARRIDQLAIEAHAIGIVRRFLEARREADRTAGTTQGKFLHHLDRQVSVDADERRIGSARQIGNRAIGYDAANLVLGRMDRPYRAGETHFQALAHDIGAEEAAADHGDRKWPQQA